MDNDFFNCNLDELHIKTFNCPCGKKHKANVDKIFFSENALSKFSLYLKNTKGIQCVLVLIENESYLSLFEEVKKALNENCFFIKHLVFESPKTIDISICEKLSRAYEQERIIIGIGGEYISNFIKYYAFKFNKYSVLIPVRLTEITLFSNKAYVLNKGKITSIVARGIDTLVIDENVYDFLSFESVSTCFSEILSSFMHIFNFNFASLLTNNSYCKHITKFVMDIIFSCIKICEGLLRKVKNDTKTLVQNMLKLNIAISFLEGLDFNEILSDEVLYILALINQYKKMDYTFLKKTKLLISLELCNIYKLYLENTVVDIDIPPNLNERAIILSKIANKKLMQMLINTNKNTTFDNYFLMQYKCNEYKNDFLKKINNISKILEFAFNQFKRLYLNDGYILKNKVEYDKLMLSINLVCDTTSSYTLLKHIVNTGILEKYVDKKIV